MWGKINFIIFENFSISYNIYIYLLFILDIHVLCEKNLALFLNAYDKFLFLNKFSTKFAV